MLTTASRAARDRLQAAAIVEDALWRLHLQSDKLLFVDLNAVARYLSRILKRVILEYRRRDSTIVRAKRSRSLDEVDAETGDVKLGALSYADLPAALVEETLSWNAEVALLHVEAEHGLEKFLVCLRRALAHVDPRDEAVIRDLTDPDHPRPLTSTERARLRRARLPAKATLERHGIHSPRRVFVGDEVSPT